jgi:hypothetical protein
MKWRWKMERIIKKAGFLAVALAGVAMLAAPTPASARVRIGVSIGAPVYAAPVFPYSYSYPYSTQYYADPYNAPYPDYPVADPYPVYPYGAPTYVAPSFSFGFGGHDRHERFEHERHERVEHRGREVRGFRR